MTDMKIYFSDIMDDEDYLDELEKEDSGQNPLEFLGLKR